MRSVSLRRQLTGWSQNAVVLALALFAWESCGAIGMFDARVMPRPSVAILAVAEHWESGELSQDVLASLWRVSVGFVIGGALGFGCGLICLGAWPRRILSPLLAAIQGIPLMAWIPIAILFFGLGDGPAFFLVSLGVFFPTFSGTYLGFSSAERTYSLAAQTLGFSWWQTIWLVTIPQALPSIFSGLRVGMGVAWMALVTVELIAVQSGLGYLLQISRSQLQTDVVVGVMGVVGGLGMLSIGLIRMAERALLPWRFTGRETLPSQS